MQKTCTCIFSGPIFYTFLKPFLSFSSIWGQGDVLPVSLYLWPCHRVKYKVSNGKLTTSTGRRSRNQSIFSGMHRVKYVMSTPKCVTVRLQPPMHLYNRLTLFKYFKQFNISHMKSLYGPLIDRTCLRQAS